MPKRSQKPKGVSDEEQNKLREAQTYRGTDFPMGKWGNASHAPLKKASDKFKKEKS
jgi:hypothetical protein